MKSLPVSLALCSLVCFSPLVMAESESCPDASNIAGAVFSKSLTSGDFEEISYWSLDDQWFLALPDKTVHWQKSGEQFLRSEWLIEQNKAIDYSHQDLKNLGELPQAIPPVSLMPNGLKDSLFGRKTNKTWKCFSISKYQGAPSGPTITLEWIDQLQLPLRYSVSLQGAAMWVELSELITKAQASKLAEQGKALKHQPFQKP